MLNSEKKMAALLLRWAADEFSNHGSNSLEGSRELKSLFTLQEREELLASYNKYVSSEDGELEPSSVLEYTMDWEWMQSLADKLEKEAAGGGEG